MGNNSDNQVLNSIQKSLNKRDFAITVFSSYTTDASRTEHIDIPSNVIEGSIYATTDSTYNGTTGTLALQASNDGVNYSILKTDDEAANISFTLAASDHNIIQIKRRLFRFYRLVFTVGNATAGVLNATFVGIRS